MQTCATMTHFSGNTTFAVTVAALVYTQIVPCILFIMLSFMPIHLP